MNRMFNLARNENMKIYSRISTWIMFVILLLLVSGIALLIKFSPGQDDKTLWEVVNRTEGLIPMISVFIIIIGSGVAANEFSTGTIKLLLIRPVKRWKILLSKYIATLLSAVFMLVVLFISSFLIGGILFGGASFNYYVDSVHGIVKRVDIIKLVFTQYGVYSVDMLMMVTLTFMIATVFRNSSLAIGVGIFLMFVGDLIVILFKQFSWIKYTLFANLDLSRYHGVPLVEGMTLTFSISVLAVYFIIFNAIAWITFIKRDVAV